MHNNNIENGEELLKDEKIDQKTEFQDSKIYEVLNKLSESEKKVILPRIQEIISEYKNEKHWSEHQDQLQKTLKKKVESGELTLRYAHEGPFKPDILNDPEIVKIEAGGVADINTLTFEHRMSPGHPLVPHTLKQIEFEVEEQGDRLIEKLKDKKIVLGDIDLGGTLGLWLVEKLKQGEDIRQYDQLIDLVSRYDLQGRIAIYPNAEPTNSLFRMAWGIEMTYQSKEEKVAAYMTLFDRLSTEQIDVNSEIPWHDKRVIENVKKLKKFARDKIDESVTKEGLHKNSLLINGVPYQRSYWDETVVQVARRFNNTRVAIVSSPTEMSSHPVILSSNFSNFYLAPLGEEMAKEKLPVWYGAGYVGIDTRKLPPEKKFSPSDMQDRIDSYIKEHREDIEGAVEFEVIFDDKDYLEKIAQEALGQIITGYTKSPEYYKITAAYLWNEYGKGLKEGEVHTKVNFDDVLVLRFLVPNKMKEKTYNYFYSRLAEKWDTPLIKMTEREVPKKFAKYTEENVTDEIPEKKRNTLTRAKRNYQ